MMMTCLFVTTNILSPVTLVRAEQNTNISRSLSMSRDEARMLGERNQWFKIIEQQYQEENNDEERLQTSGSGMKDGKGDKGYSRKYNKGKGKGMMSRKKMNGKGKGDRLPKFCNEFDFEEDSDDDDKNDSHGKGAGKGKGKGYGKNMDKGDKGHKMIYGKRMGNGVGRRVQDDGAFCDPNVLETARSNEDISTFVALLDAAGLSEIFQCSGPFTCFAPTNTAFDALDPTIVEELLNPDNVRRLQNILLYHLVPGLFLSEDLGDGNLVTLLDAQSIRVTVGPVLINGDIGIVDADILACNGVIHTLENVLLPGIGVPTRPPIPVDVPISTPTLPTRTIRPTVEPVRASRQPMVAPTTIDTVNPAISSISPSTDNSNQPPPSATCPCASKQDSVGNSYGIFEGEIDSDFVSTYPIRIHYNATGIFEEVPGQCFSSKGNLTMVQKGFIQFVIPEFIVGSCIVNGVTDLTQTMGGLFWDYLWRKDGLARNDTGNLTLECDTDC